jgi:hypothetical protein
MGRVHGLCCKPPLTTLDWFVDETILDLMQWSDFSMNFKAPTKRPHNLAQIMKYQSNKWQGKKKLAILIYWQLLYDLVNDNTNVESYIHK